MLEKKGRITMTKEQQTILNKAKKIFDQVEGYSNEYELKKDGATVARMKLDDEQTTLYNSKRIKSFLIWWNDDMSGFSETLEEIYNG